MKQYLKEVYSKLLFMDVTSNGDKAWFCNVYFPALFEFDLKSFDIKLVSFLPAVKKDKFNSYSAIEYYNGKLIIAPRNESQILIFDLSENHIEKCIELDVSSMYTEDNVFNLFSKICIVGNNAYLIPGRYPGIVKIDLSDYSIVVLDKWYYDNLDAIIEKDRVITSSATIVKNELLITFWQVPQIMSFDIVNETYNIIDVICKEKYICDITSDNESSYFVNTNKNIIYWLSDVNKCIDINQHKDSFGEGITKICNIENELIVFPTKGSNILSINKTTHEITNSTNCVRIINEQQKKVAFVDNQFICAKSIDSKHLLACSLYEGKIYYYNGDVWNKIPLILPTKYESDIDKYVRSIFLYGNKLLYENNEMKLNEWISYIKPQNDTDI